MAKAPTPAINATFVASVLNGIDPDGWGTASFIMRTLPIADHRRIWRVIALHPSRYLNFLVQRCMIGWTDAINPAAFTAEWLEATEITDGFRVLANVWLVRVCAQMRADTPPDDVRLLIMREVFRVCATEDTDAGVRARLTAQ